MGAESSTARVFYGEWAKYQQSVKEAVTSLTAEQLCLRAAPGLRSIGEIAQHIVAARAWWFKGFMNEGSDEITAYFEWDDEDAPERGAEALGEGFATTWELMNDALVRWDPSDMAHTFPHTWRGDEYQLSRNWVVWHVLEHDLHHGGEISILLGMYGLQAPDI
jgi:uncharacterized damage-inducible protein DinB